MIWVIIGSAACGGCVVGLILGKLFTEREMTENRKQYGYDMHVEGYHEGFRAGYHERDAEVRRLRRQ